MYLELKLAASVYEGGFGDVEFGRDACETAALRTKVDESLLNLNILHGTKLAMEAGRKLLRFGVARFDKSKYFDFEIQFLLLFSFRFAKLCRFEFEPL